MKFPRLLLNLVTVIVLIAIDNILMHLMGWSAPLRLVVWAIIGINAALLYYGTLDMVASEPNNA